MKAKLIVTIALLIFVIIFIIQNAVMVDVRLLVWEFTMSRSLLILAMLFIGIVIGWFLRTLYRIIRHKTRV